jgi:hypothetical protein
MARGFTLAARAIAMSIVPTKGQSILAGTRGANMENQMLSQVGAISANWSLIHGLSLLLSAGRLGTIVRIAPEGTTKPQLLTTAARAVQTH